MLSQTSSPDIAHRRAAWIVWIAIAAVVVTVVTWSAIIGEERTVVHHYRIASQNWFSGQPLYSMNGHAFLYFPQAAIVFAPWAILPPFAGEIAFRLCELLVVAFSVSRLTRALKGNDRWYFVNVLVTGALCVGTARVGQSTLMVTGLMILGTVELIKKRWWRATGLLVLALIFKPHAFVMLLLAGAVSMQMSVRLVIGLLLSAVIPFAFQRPDYVLAQYIDFFGNFQITFHVGEITYWPQFFGMLQVVGIDLPAALRTEVRLASAALTLVACLLAVRKLAPERAFFYVYSFAAVYVLLMNPRTEGNTYCMIAPVYGVLLADAMLRQKNPVATAGMLVAVIATVFHYDLGHLIAPVPREVWTAPLVCCGVTSYLSLKLSLELTSRQSLNLFSPAMKQEDSAPSEEWSIAA